VENFEIRSKILIILYYYHYSGFAGDLFQIDKVLSDSRLNFHNKNIISGDLVYLTEKGYITGPTSSGHIYPIAIKITPRGIDIVEKIITEFLNFLKSPHDKNIDEEEKKEMLIQYRTVNAISGSSKLKTIVWLITDKLPSIYKKFCKNIENKINIDEKDYIPNLRRPSEYEKLLDDWRTILDLYDNLDNYVFQDKKAFNDVVNRVRDYFPIAKRFKELDDQAITNTRLDLLKLQIDLRKLYEQVR
jgi:hypothetical protein